MIRTFSRERKFKLAFLAICNLNIPVLFLIRTEKKKKIFREQTIQRKILSEVQSHNNQSWYLLTASFHVLCQRQPNIKISLAELLVLSDSNLVQLPNSFFNASSDRFFYFFRSTSYLDMESNQTISYSVSSLERVSYKMYDYSISHPS